MEQKFYITTAIDYINAKPHIGHAYEKVASDVLARFYRGRGVPTRFLTGTDEHGTKISKAAEAANQPIEEFARETAAKFSFAWDQLNIVPDRFIRTTDADHIKVVQELVQKIKDNGYAYEGEYKGWYCTSCETFYTETDAPDHICPIHKTPLELITEKNWFLKISEFAPTIKQKIERDELKIWPTSAKNEILSWLNQGFNDVAISRPNVKWGIPLPWDEQQTIYVWVDALINYVTGARDETGKDWWPASMHIIGKDISKFHSIIWPAILLAAGLELPTQVVVHGYLTVGGEKMSKSVGNVIDPNDWVAKYGADAVRYLLLREVAFGEDGDVSEEKLKSRYEGDLANGLGNLVSRVTTLWEKFGNNEKVEGPSLYDLSKVDESLEKFAFHQALQEIWNSVKIANETVDHNKLWEMGKTDQKKFVEITKQILVTIKEVAEKLTSFTPVTSQKILHIINQEKITKAQPIFPRIP